jgi:hypothetical protein
MQISRIEMTKPQIDTEQRVCRADVALYLDATDKVTDQAVHLTCKSILSGTENAQNLRYGLLRDALRQMRWMPEFRTGEMTLKDLPTITGVETL